MSTYTMVNTDCRSISAIDGETYLGSCLVSPYSDGAYVFRLQVQPEHRQVGIGTALLHEAIRVAFQYARWITIEPLPFDDAPLSRDQLVRWCMRHGFAPYEDGRYMMLTNPDRPAIEQTPKKFIVKTGEIEAIVDALNCGEAAEAVVMNAVDSMQANRLGKITEVCEASSNPTFYSTGNVISNARRMRAVGIG